jgi:hypothetical protein
MFRNLPLVVLALVLSTFASSSPVYAQTNKPPAPVVVSNTPLPVLVSNPVTSVAISGTPTVTVSNPVTAVTISGTLATKNIDERGRAPYQFFIGATRGEPQCGTNFCGFYIDAVPANMRLVITNVSATISLDATAVVQHLRLLVYSPSYAILSQFTVPYNPNSYPQDPISSNSPRRYVVNEQLQYFVEGGQQLLVEFHTTGGELDTAWPNQFLITGYLVDLSQ